MVISSKTKMKADKGNREHLWDSGLGGTTLNRLTFERGAEEGEALGEEHSRQRGSQGKELEQEACLVCLKNSWRGAREGQAGSA